MLPCRYKGIRCFSNPNMIIVLMPTFARSMNARGTIGSSWSTYVWRCFDPHERDNLLQTGYPEITVREALRLMSGQPLFKE